MATLLGCGGSGDGGEPTQKACSGEGLSAISYQLSAISYQLSAISYQLGGAGFGLSLMSAAADQPTARSNAREPDQPGADG
jgi:hypothetical protein